MHLGTDTTTLASDDGFNLDFQMNNRVNAFGGGPFPGNYIISDMINLGVYTYLPVSDAGSDIEFPHE